MIAALVTGLAVFMVGCVYVLALIVVIERLARLWDPLERIWRLPPAEDPPLAMDWLSYQAARESIRELETIEPVRRIES